MDWYPSVGKSSLPTDPASVLGKEMYARVRAAYSGTLRADAPDYVIYVMALDSIFSYIGWLKRLYRTLSAYTSQNYVLPDVLLGAMGLTQEDITSLRANKTQLWQLINELVHQSRKFTCPASMDIMNRHYWMSDNLYTDDTSLNSQFYLFNLRGVFKYMDLSVESQPTIKAPGLQMFDLPWVRESGDTTILTPTNLYEFGRDLIDAMVAWDESYTINGYLQRAYEGSPTFVLAELAQEEMLQPSFAPEVLMQIENSHTIPFVASNKSSTMIYVRQDPATNAIVSDPQIWMKQTDLGANTRAMIAAMGLDTMRPYLSIRTDNPTPAENIIASRLMTWSGDFEITKKIWHDGDEPATLDTYIPHIEAGTEVAFGWHLIDSVAPSNATLLSGRRAKAYEQYIISIGASIDAYLKNILAAEMFDWHPKSLVLWRTGTSTEGYKYEVIPIGDIHNVTTISQDDLANLHRVCAFSEFNSFSMM